MPTQRPIPSIPYSSEKQSIRVSTARFLSLKKVLFYTKKHLEWAIFRVRIRLQWNRVFNWHLLPKPSRQQQFCCWHRTTNSSWTIAYNNTFPISRIMAYRLRIYSAIEAVCPIICIVLKINASRKQVLLPTIQL